MEVETRDEVANLVAEVLPEYADQIIPHLLPSIRFNGVLSPDHRPALQLGGGTALPPDIPWPEHDGRMMHLVAVVDLEQVAEVDPTGAVPCHGLLHFFYDALATKWGYDPSHAESWSVVLVTEEPTDTEHPLRYRPSYPEDEESVHFSGPVLLEELFGRPYVQWTAPGTEEEELANIEWERNERGGLEWGLINRLSHLEYELGFERHQMLGWPRPVQNPMRLQCQLVSNGLYCGDSSSTFGARATTAASGAPEACCTSGSGSTTYAPRGSIVSG